MFGQIEIQPCAEGCVHYAFFWCCIRTQKLGTVLLTTDATAPVLLVLMHCLFCYKDGESQSHSLHYAEIFLYLAAVDFAAQHPSLGHLCFL